MANKKMKVSKTVKDRFKVTKGGKVLHDRGGLKHRRSKESTSLRTRGKRIKELDRSDAKRIKRLLGIGK